MKATKTKEFWKMKIELKTQRHTKKCKGLYSGILDWQMLSNTRQSLPDSVHNTLASSHM
jgi:hypothetical protein